MNKMREAWEAECKKFNLNPDYNQVWKEKFEAGYQAAIATVKEGGPVWVVYEKGTLGKEIPLYRIPEDTL